MLDTRSSTKIHKEMFNKKLKVLIILGFLKYSNDSKWGAPYFKQPKPKTNRVCLINDFIH